MCGPSRACMWSIDVQIILYFVAHRSRQEMKLLSSEAFLSIKALLLMQNSFLRSSDSSDVYTICLYSTKKRN